MANQTIPKGWHVLPLHTMVDDHCSCGKVCGSPGKHPRVWRGFKDASYKPEDIAYWLNKWPGTNLGLRTGIESGVVVIDVDPGNGGLESLHDLLKDHPVLPATVTVKTGGDGFHYYFRHPGGKVACSIGKKLGKGIDVRGDGGYVVMAGSNHVSGGQYTYTPGHSPDEIEIADMPDWLVQCLTA